MDCILIGEPLPENRRTEIHFEVIFLILPAQEITVEMDFIATWTDWLIFEANRHVFYELNLTDENLERSFKTLDASILGHIWKPDLFIGKLLLLIVTI